MKATDLRIGNIVTLAYEDFKPNVVLILEPGLVHLLNRLHPDDERDIEGIPITEGLLHEYKVPSNKIFLIQGTNVKIDVVQDIKPVWLHIKNLTFQLHFIHELQNIIHLISGREIIITLPFIQNYSYGNCKQVG